MTDAVDVLSRVSGVSRAEVLDIWAQVKADKAKAEACPRHVFPAGMPRIGQRVACTACGVPFSLTQVGAYVRGYEAAGGSADDVWPGWHGGSGRAS